MKVHSEDIILYCLKEFGQTSLSHWDLFDEMVSTFHLLENITRDVHSITKRRLDCDSLAVDLFHLEVSCLGKILVQLKFLSVPKCLLL